MEYKQRDYPMLAVCGLNCGLCPRFYTNGRSRCPGCSGEGFSQKHLTCSILSCCQRKELDYCFSCDEYPCIKYDGADSKDSFITHKNQLTYFCRVQQIGIEAYKAEVGKRIEILEILLKGYDDSRRKSFYCLAVNLFDIQVINTIMSQIDDEIDLEDTAEIKAKTATRILQALADEKGIILKLRK